MQKEDLNRFYDSAISYLGNEMAEGEKEVFIDSLNEDDKLKGLFFQLKDVWEYHQLKEQSSKIDLDLVWEQMVSKQQAKADTSLRSKRNIKSWYWQSAAAVLVVAGLLWLFNSVKSPLTGNQTLAHVIECSKGDMVKISLSDGSYVWLNSDSKLSLDENFSSQNRQLSLVGEAFFDVRSDSLNPFSIDVADHQVRVKGTSFNLRHYPDENLFQTSLEEGIIEINQGREILKLAPGEQLNVNTITGEKELLKDQNLKQYSAWRTGRLEFENLPMEQLAKHIERWYNHTIIIKDEELLTLKFSGVLKHNKSVEHIMRVLSLTHPIKYEIEEDTIFIEQLK
ncbi:FecR family protein [Carboxylicivirga sp. RSCT41]|uniref:FecR family protein n=1 Tax=Carboxylicivirga agarovorans TaxID=3417570 RepID=UPI003D346048